MTASDQIVLGGLVLCLLVFAVSCADPKPPEESIPSPTPLTPWQREPEALTDLSPTLTPTPLPEPTPTPILPTPTTISTPSTNNVTASSLTPPSGDREGAVYALLAKYCDAPGCLSGAAAILVQVADEYGIDYRVLPAISVHESSGGAASCGYNAWGYGSCRGYNFSSWEEGARASAELFVRVGGRENIHYALRVWVAGGNGAANGAGYGYADKVIATMNSMQ